MSFVTLDKSRPMSAVLKVVGIGGGGCNAIQSMIKRGLDGVEFVTINTDAQVLDKIDATHKLQIGKSVTRGLGAGADPRIGKKAVEEDKENIKKILEGTDMVFITAGMGGGTGTGGAATVAEIAKSLDALVIGIVTKPFRWEGKKRLKNAEQGIEELRQFVDSLIVIPNERILNILDGSATATAAFDKPNEVLYEATRGIADIITIPGIINVDFADVRSVMNSSGEALMGCGIASGENRAIEAAQKAISSPLLEGINIKGAKNILLNVTGSNNLTMQEINEGNEIIYEAAGEEANVIFGWVNKEEMGEYVSYTVIATGFNSKDSVKSQSQIQKTEPKEEQKSAPIRGGYVFGKEEKEKIYSEVQNENTDYNIPTIFRVKGTTQNMSSNPSYSSGFKYQNFSDLEEPKSKKENNSDDEEDSSSFLKMMMD
ncbi:MAG: cell division protein FtsZ [Melioribacteraceae bacterium]|jgi:cell division protein FtsZ|nr:cell division protein FtsZ [Melioribacteraceae bacterium]